MPRLDLRLGSRVRPTPLECPALLQAGRPEVWMRAWFAWLSLVLPLACGAAPIDRSSEVLQAGARFRFDLDASPDVREDIARTCERVAGPDGAAIQRCHASFRADAEHQDLTFLPQHDHWRWRRTNVDEHGQPHELERGTVRIVDARHGTLLLEPDPDVHGEAMPARVLQDGRLELVRPAGKLRLVFVRDRRATLDDPSPRP